MSSLNTFTVQVYPATAERWNDIETLFGPRGACAGCWCMWWRLRRTDFRRLDEEGRKAILRDLTLQNAVPGILAYVEGRPVGWCAIGPREHYHALGDSRILRRVDDLAVWSIVCYFVSKGYRRQGVTLALLRGALRYAKEQGATIVEGYPIDLQTPKLAGQKLSGSAGYIGVASVFRAAGFVEVRRASETQLIMRCTLS